jgi:ABC-2 type transport system ATP-binding protein
MIAQISRLDNVVSAERMGGDINVRLRGNTADMAVLFRQMAELDFPIYGMSESSNALEDRYLALIKESR